MLSLKGKRCIIQPQVVALETLGHTEIHEKWGQLSSCLEPMNYWLWCWVVLVNLTWTSIICQEGTSAEGLPSLYLPMDKCGVIVLINA